MKRLANCLVSTVLIILIMCQSVCAAQLLVPGGQLIGIGLQDDTVTVVSFEGTAGEASQAAGLQVGDRLLTIDGQTIRCTKDVQQALSRSDGTVRLRVLRKGKEANLQLWPEATADGPKLGVCLREGISGVGTVTYYEPGTGRFGALGHSVSHGGSEPLPTKEGKVFHAKVLSIRKGQAGDPGQLMGTLSDRSAIGEIWKNTEQGIFGTLHQPIAGEKLPVAEKSQIHTGSAVIRSTIGSDGLQEYSVEILKIYPNPRNANRNMLLRVTDPRLLETTGGIVQGMSGSPIIQDGKLVGAVTHVLVNDPTTGYGIFIENMLDAAA